MLKGKRLYLALALMTIFALSGGQAQLGEDLRKTSTVVGRLLQINGVSYQISSIKKVASSNVKRLTGQLISNIKLVTEASTEESKPKTEAEKLTPRQKYRV